MTQIFEPAVEARLVERLARLEPDARARWGKFTAPKMLAHLNDALRMATGELDVTARPGPLRMPVLRYLALGQRERDHEDQHHRPAVLRVTIRFSGHVTRPGTRIPGRRKPPRVHECAA